MRLQKEFCNKYYLQTHKATKHGTGYSLATLMNSSNSSQHMPVLAEANAVDLQNMMLAALDQV